MKFIILYKPQRRNEKFVLMNLSQRVSYTAYFCAIQSLPHCMYRFFPIKSKYYLCIESLNPGYS